jgi:hypothetical protein
MAKLTSPLFSRAASGTIGKTITYSGGRGGFRALKYTAPAGTGNLARKSLYADGCAAWQQLSAAEKSAWKATAQPLCISGFNAFMSNYLLTPSGAGIPWDNGTAIWDNGTAIWS